MCIYRLYDNFFYSIQQNTMDFLNQQYVLIATAIQPLEPSNTHKICTNF